MTIQVEEVAIQYLGDGSSVTFGYSFTATEEEWVLVYIAGIFKTVNIDYTLNLDLKEITFIDPPGDSLVVSILRDVPADQAIDYVPYDSFPAETHEFALDKLTMLIQQSLAVNGNSIRVPNNETGLSNLVTPPIEFRRNMVLAFDESGNVTVVAGPGGVTATFVGTSAGANGYTDSRAMLTVDNITGGARLPLIAVQPPNQGNALIQLAGGAIPQAVVDASAIVQNIIPQLLVDGGGVGVDIELLTATNVNGVETIGVSNPNQASYLLQLDEFGQIPAELLAFQGLRNLGSYRGDNLCPKVGDDGPDCTNPDYRNPSQRFTTAIFETGDQFAVVIAAGEEASDNKINLYYDDGAGNYVLGDVAVQANDGIQYLDVSATLPDLPTGWYHLPDRFNQTTADLVSMTPLPNYLVGPSVQHGMQQADTQLLANQIATSAAQSTADAAEPGNANIQAHIVDNTNPHSVTAAQAGAEAANSNIQAHIADVTTNPHDTTAGQVGAPAGSWTWDGTTLAITVT